MTARRHIIVILLLAIIGLQTNANVMGKLKIIYTTDVHGNFFPYDFVDGKEASGSLARVKTAIDSIRKCNDVILLDNGDILQGQPTVYYYNYIATDQRHIVPRIFKTLEYDAATVGNHDVETGHSVYDRVYGACDIPILAANMIDKASGEPYRKPYAVFEKNGVKVAVLGLVTPAIPAWLPEVLWSGIEFEDMETSARKWMEIIKTKKSPDVVIGLFHAGQDNTKKTGGFNENASVDVAITVPGFDAVLIGHDHRTCLKPVRNVDGEDVIVVNPANNAQYLGIVDVIVQKNDNGEISSKRIEAELLDVREIAVSEVFMNEYHDDIVNVKRFVDRVIGESQTTMKQEDAFFGPSSFMTLLHNLQLEISGAEISFASPLSPNSIIKKGALTVSDMFKLYKYENMLYTIELTGEEIKNYLEKSYDLWTDRITDSQRHIIKFADTNPTYSCNQLKNPSYNFDSAAGIEYTVDITKPYGEKINILSMADGKAFEPGQKYKVAVNSYRGNGGGNLLTEGAGIPVDELESRIIFSTDKDLRYYLLNAVEQKKTIDVKTDCNWKFIPEEIASKAIATDRDLLFSDKSTQSHK